MSVIVGVNKHFKIDIIKYFSLSWVYCQSFDWVVEDCLMQNSGFQMKKYLFGKQDFSGISNATFFLLHHALRPSKGFSCFASFDRN